MDVAQDTLWGQPCLAYNLQAALDAEAQRSLCTLQRAVEERVPARLLLPPAATMHVSLYALVYVHWTSPHKQAYWERIAEPTLALLAQLCSAQPPFRLAFGRLRVSERAIIALSPAPCEPIAALRRELGKLLAAPDVSRPNHDIIHTTVARFGESAQLRAETVHEIEQLQLACELEVSALSVVREQVYPSLRSEEVRRYALAATLR